MFTAVLRSINRKWQNWWIAEDEREMMLVNGMTLTQSSSSQYTSAWLSVGRYICTKPSQRALVRRTLKQLIPLHGLFAHLLPLCYSNSQPYTHSARIEDEGH